MLCSCFHIIINVNNLYPRYVYAHVDKKINSKLCLNVHMQGHLHERLRIQELNHCLTAWLLLCNVHATNANELELTEPVA